MKQSGLREREDIVTRIAPSRVEDARKRAYGLIRVTFTVRGSKFAN